MQFLGLEEAGQLGLRVVDAVGRMDDVLHHLGAEVAADRALRSLARISRPEQVAHTLPHKETYLLLNHALARRIVQAHAEWLDEVERELGGR